MPNVWIKQAYAQGWMEDIFIFLTVNIFECMEISETIYEVFV